MVIERISPRTGFHAWLSSVVRGALAVAAVVVLTSSTALWAAGDSEDALKAEIDAALQDRRLNGAAIGVHVVTAGSGRVLYSHNGVSKLIPASNQKLITAAAALDKLGDKYEFKTYLYVSGAFEPKKGAIEGDLILSGGGDPTLGSRLAPEKPLEQFDSWVELLKMAGIKRITGTLVVDELFFDRERVHPDWPAEQLDKTYCAPISALSFMDNCVTITVMPGEKAGEATRVSTLPNFPFFQVLNRSQTASKSEGVWFSRKPESLEVEVRGNVKPGGGGESGDVTVPRPELFAGAALADALRRGGIEVNGTVRLATEADLAGKGRWLKLISRRTPVSRVLRVMLKESDNLYAEHVIKTLGAEKAGNGSWQAGLGVAGQMLQRLGFRQEEFDLADGSGMSRGNRISPALLCAVLTKMARSPYATQFRESLPVSGVDGTLAKRLNDPACKNKVFAKTGYLYGVGALSGYADTKSGLRVAFSILINDFKDKGGNASMKDIQDRIVRAIVGLAK